eukprot:Rmarinus@m.24602
MCGGGDRGQGSGVAEGEMGAGENQGGKEAEGDPRLGYPQGQGFTGVQHRASKAARRRDAEGERARPAPSQPDAGERAHCEGNRGCEQGDGQRTGSKVPRTPEVVDAKGARRRDGLGKVTSGTAGQRVAKTCGAVGEARSCQTCADEGGDGDEAHANRRKEEAAGRGEDGGAQRAREAGRRDIPSCRDGKTAGVRTTKARPPLPRSTSQASATERRGENARNLESASRAGGYGRDGKSLSGAAGEGAGENHRPANSECACARSWAAESFASTTEPHFGGRHIEFHTVIATPFFISYCVSFFLYMIYMLSCVLSLLCSSL